VVPDFSFDTLLFANGMVKEGSFDRKKEMVEKILNSRDRGIEAKCHAKNTIVNALLERGLIVQNIPRSFQSMNNEAPYSISYCPDFGFYFEDASQHLSAYSDLLRRQFG
jgi:hypothetical protein